MPATFLPTILTILGAEAKPRGKRVRKYTRRSRVKRVAAGSDSADETSVYGFSPAYRGPGRIGQSRPGAEHRRRCFETIRWPGNVSSFNQRACVAHIRRTYESVSKRTFVCPTSVSNRRVPVARDDRYCRRTNELRLLIRPKIRRVL